MTPSHKRNRVCQLRALTRAGARQQSGRRAGGACSTGLQPRILQLNTEGLTASKISVIEKLAYTFKALVILLQIPKIWRRALVVAIPKPNKPEGDPKSYRPISLLCIPFKILERLIYARVEPIVDPLLPGSRLGSGGRSTVDQVTLLTQDIEDSFSAKKKAGAVLSI
ncbi:hypothetical protein AAFF_G00384320 [Aldrovandia affinis]|uniref:Reverse transcriptase domain-containing protein n=1 Tax=Aldrovandia affinis TaxID=143900 RepID=A0AAD7SFH7_9TELE|nr:hypothetical protein AAFF_G00384320 [Aldrovandia affinis]